MNDLANAIVGEHFEVSWRRYRALSCKPVQGPPHQHVKFPLCCGLEHLLKPGMVAALARRVVAVLCSDLPFLLASEIT